MELSVIVYKNLFSHKTLVFHCGWSRVYRRSPLWKGGGWSPE